MAKAKKPAQEIAKLEPLPIPASTAEASKLELMVGEYLNLVAQKQKEIALLEDDIKTSHAELARLGEALHQYAVAERRNLLDPEESTLHLPQAGTLGWIKSRRVIVTYAATQVIAWLKKHRLKRFIRIGKETLNKEAMHDNPDALKKVPGLTIKDCELFVVRPLGQALRIERDPDGEWSVKANEKKRAPKPMAQAAS